MRKLLQAAIFAISLAALLPAGRAQENPTAAASESQVSGSIRLRQGKSGKSAEDASDVVVWLIPLDPLPPMELRASRRTYRMVQQNKQFHPHLLVIPLGSVVLFPNLDPWFHNVFSLYRGKRFDLGLYEAGSQKAVRFNQLGASYIFCNIHPQMMAVVLTVDTPYYAISDKTGHWAIANVPVGRYRLHVWYENATPAALQALGRVVQVAGGNAVLAKLSIPIASRDLMNHKNLYGHQYEPNTLSPVY